MNIEKTGSIEQNNPLERAKKLIEKKLIALDEKMEIFALQASMIRSWDGTHEEATIESDEKQLFTQEQVDRFYKIDSGFVQGTRNFVFNAFGIDIPIEYRLNKKIDKDGNLVNVFNRFSEKYIIQLEGTEFVFEGLEECSNFMFNIARALDYKKHNGPVIFDVYEDGDIHVQTVKNDGKNMKVKHNFYYWEVMNVHKMGIKTSDQITYREEDSYTSTELNYDLFEGERDWETVQNDYLQKYEIDKTGLNEARVQEGEEGTFDIHEKIEAILNK